MRFPPWPSVSYGSYGPRGPKDVQYPEPVIVALILLMGTGLQVPECLLRGLKATLVIPRSRHAV